MTVDPAAARRIEQAGETLSRVREEVARAVVGQKAMVDRLLIGLLTGGHVLLEGVPGLAKTLAVSSLAKALSLKFRRIQFTPDLLPADLTGTLIYNPKEGTFSAKRGPRAGTRCARARRRTPRRGRERFGRVRMGCS